jgi:RNA polymerase sigma-70 factor (ECF subfamily)
MERAGAREAAEAAEAVARRSYARLVRLLSARTRDVAGAEDALSSAFAAALADWPASGVPRNPEAWVLAVARRSWIDAARRRRSAEKAAGHLRLLAEEVEAAAGPPDEPFALTFVCAHPAIDPVLRAPLLLQALFGFDAAAIASAYRVSPAGMSQRLVRAKKKIREAGPRLEAPGGAELAARREAVREALGAAVAKVGLAPRARRDPGGCPPRLRRATGERAATEACPSAPRPDR